MLKRMHSLLNFRILVIGVFAVIALTLVLCSAEAAIASASHADETGCVRVMVSVGCATVQRVYDELAITPLAGLLVMSVLGFIGHWTLSRPLMTTRWQIVFQEIDLNITDFLQDSFRRGILHGQIYNQTFNLS